jgi:methionyl-tRNA synthetase
LRFFFLREVMFGQDGNYSPEAISNRINADLANNLGNLAQRSLSMIYKNCDGQIPVPAAFSAEDTVMLAAADGLYKTARAEMDRQALTKYLDAVWSVVSDANQYFAAGEPWAKKKTDPERMGTILYVTAEVVRQFAILAQPAMPESCNKLLDLMAVAADARTFAYLGKTGRLTGGTPIPEPQGVFPRYIDPAEAEAQAQQKADMQAKLDAKAAAKKGKQT